MPEAKGKVKISVGGFFKKLLIVAGIIYVVTNPLSAAMRVHDLAYWIGSWFG